LWSGFNTWIFAISTVAVVVAIPCAGLAWYGFVLARRNGHAAHPHPHRHEKLRTPEQLRRDDTMRVRFIALCSVLVGTGFLIGAIFIWLAPVLVDPCHTGY
jgi:hypothetical protein